MTPPIMIALSSILALSACSGVLNDDVSPHVGTTENNTIVTYVDGLGSQVVYIDPDGTLAIWRSGSTEIQRGLWRYDQLQSGSSTSFVGQAGINFPVENIDTEWGLCFQFLDAAGNILRRDNGGDWNCATFDQYESLVVDRATGDRFALSTAASAPSELPLDRPVTLAELGT